MQRIEKTLGGDAVSIFLQGCSGDINPGLYADSVYCFPQAEKYAGRLSDQVLSRINKIKTKGLQSADVRYREVSLKMADMGISEAEARLKLTANIAEIDDFYNFFQKPGEWGRFVWDLKPVEMFSISSNGIIKTYIHTVALGNTAFAFYPGQPFVAFALQTKMNRRFRLLSPLIARTGSAMCRPWKHLKKEDTK